MQMNFSRCWWSLYECVWWPGTLAKSLLENTNVKHRVKSVTLETDLIMTCGKPLIG